MAATTSGPQYVPTPEELNDAISVLLKEKQTAPSAKQTRKQLQRENPTWKLNERRIAKFLKKQKKAQQNADKNTVPAEEDDEEASVNSVSSIASRTKQIVQGAGTSLKSTGKSIRKKIFSTTNKDKENTPASEKNKRSSFPFRRKKKDEKESPVKGSSFPTEVRLTLLPDTEVEEHEDDLLEPEAQSVPSPIAVPEQETKPEVADRNSDVYVDENTGKPEPKLCAGCAGCIIL